MVTLHEKSGRQLCKYFKLYFRIPPKPIHHEDNDCCPIPPRFNVDASQIRFENYQLLWFDQTNPILAAEDGHPSSQAQGSDNKTKKANDKSVNSFLDSFIGGPCVINENCSPVSVCAGDDKCHTKIWFWPVVLGLPIVIMSSLTCSYLCGFFKCCCWTQNQQGQHQTG